MSEAEKLNRRAAWEEVFSHEALCSTVHAIVAMMVDMLLAPHQIIDGEGAGETILEACEEAAIQITPSEGITVRRALGKHNFKCVYGA